jgi:hypothetical protein
MANEDYEIGWGKPPKANQYPNGRSGNPSGRPPRVRKAIWELIDHYMMQKREVLENGTVCKRTYFELILRQLESQALKKPTKRLARIEAKYEAFARAMPIRRKRRMKGKRNA